MYNDRLGLQSTPPDNFRCINGNEIGENPNFAWDFPDYPEIHQKFFRYRVYRSENFGPFYCISSDIRGTDWIDSEIVIDPNGIRIRYYINAYTDRSPKSEYSALVLIRGYISKTGYLTSYPNPFNPETTIRYHLAEASLVTIKIFNLLGEEVITLIDQSQLQGNHAIQWNGRDRFGNTVANGVYWLRLDAGKYVGNRKLVVVR